MKRILFILGLFVSVVLTAQVGTIPTITGSNSGDGEIKLIVAAAQANDNSLQTEVTTFGDSLVTALLKADSAVIIVLNYMPPHGAMSFADSTAVVALSQNGWAKITNLNNDLFTVQDADDLTLAGDSVTISIDGDYIINWSLSFSGTANDVFQIAIYKNAVIESVKMSRKTSNNDTGNMGLPAYIENLVVGDDISFYIRNTGDNDDATMVSSSIIIYMLHPD